MASRYGLQCLHTGEEPEVDIVFVHGLFGSAKNTWTAKVPAGESTARASPTSPHSSSQQPDPKTKSKFWSWDRKGRDKSSVKGEANDQFDSAPVSSVKSNGSETNDNKSKKEVFWPKDLLPLSFPQSRISSWGYDADINHFLSSASQNTIFQHAQGLLSDLADSRTTDEEKRRPLIFIAHSLGGIVVKQMLNASRNEVTHLQEILPATYGVIFFGTPHQGTSLATIAKIGQESTKVFLKSPNVSILRALEVNSETLDHINRGFSQILEIRKEFQVHSFREELPTKGIMVVKPFSSTLLRATEVVTSINADHRNMVRFSSASETGYQRVAAVLERWHSDIRSQKRKNSQPDTVPVPSNLLHKEADAAEIANLKVKISDQLNPTDFQLELTDSDFERCPETGTWLLVDAKMDHFLNDSNETSIFLCGGPGVGKTYLMFLIVDKLRDGLPRRERTSLAYFFCDSKTEAPSKRTALAIMRTFSAQLLEQVAKDNPKFVEDKLAVLAKFQQDTQSAISIFRDTVVKCLEHFNTNYIVIDALDECDDWKQIIKMVQTCPPRVRSTLRIVLSSRDVFGIPEILQNIQKFYRFNIDRELMESDLAKYVSFRLERLNTTNLGTHEEALNMLMQGSNGLFLLAKMQLDYLENEIFLSDSDVKSAVEKLPRNLFSYYERSLSRLSAENFQRAKVMFEWIMYSRSPLTVRELGIACVAKAHESSANEPSEKLTIAEIKSLGGGLIEIMKDRVQLLHATTKEFLASYNWKEASTPGHENRESAIHGHIAVKCIDYLSNTKMVLEILLLHGVENALTRKYHFLSYATQYWIDHVRLSASNDRSMIDKVVQFFESDAGLAWWVRYAGSVEFQNWWKIPRLTSTFQEWSYQNPLLRGTCHSPTGLLTELYRKRVTLFQDFASDEERPSYIGALIVLADDRCHYMKYEEAEKLYGKALDEAIRLSTPASALWRIKVIMDMSNMFRTQGLFSKAISLCDQVLAAPEVSNKTNLRLYLSAQQLRADLEHDLGHHLVSEKILRGSLDQAKKELDQNDPDVLAMRNTLALVYRSLGNIDEAIKLIDMRNFELVLGPDHPSTLTAKGNVSAFLVEQGRVQEGIDIARLVWQRQQEISGPSSVVSITAGLNLAASLRVRGLSTEALNYQQAFLKQVLELVQPSHFLALEVEAQLASTFAIQGKAEIAIHHQTHVLSERTKQFGENHRWTMLAKSGLSVMYQRHNRFKDAERLILEVLKVMENDPDIAYAETCRIKQNLAIIRRKQSRLREAEEIQLWVIDERRKHLGDDSPTVLAGWSVLARIKSDLACLKEAEEIERMVLLKLQKKEDGTSPEVIAAMANLGLTLQELGRLDEAEIFQRQALKAYQENEEEYSPNVLLSMRNLAITRQRKGQLSAKEEVEEQILHMCKSGNQDSSSRLQTMTNLAYIKHDLGKLEEAEQLFIEVAEAYRRAQGDKGLHALEAMSNLMWIKGSRGKMQEAESLATQVIAAQKETTGEDSPAVITTTMRLARVKQDQGKSHEALTLYNWVLQKRQKNEGESSRNVMKSKRDLAVIFQELGKYEEAERLQLEILHIWKMNENGDTPNLLSTMGDLRSLKEAQGKLDEAENLQTDLVERWKKVQREDHPGFLEAKSSLALIKRELGKWEEAEALWTVVVETYRRKNDNESPSLLRDIESLAWTKGALRKLHEAVELQQLVVDIRQKSGDESSPKLLRSMSSLAALKLQIGEAEEAEKLQTRAIEMYRLNGTEEGLEAMHTLSDLSWTKRNRGNLKEAIELQEKVLKFYWREYSENNFATLQAIKRLAQLKSEDDKLEEAEQLFKHVLQKMKEIGAANSHVYIETKAAYAVTLRCQGNCEQAESFQQEVLEARTQRGEEDFEVLVAMTELAMTKVELGKLEEAEVLFERVLAVCKNIENGTGPDMVIALKNLMEVKQELNKLEEAELLQEQILELYRQNRHADEENISGAVKDLDLTRSQPPPYS